MDKFTASNGKSIRWVFLFGLWPRFVVFVLFLLFASLKSAWEICGSSFLVWLWFSFLLLQSICRLQGPFVLAHCISCLFSCKDRTFSATSAKLEEKRKFTVPVLGPSGGTKNETAKSQNPAKDDLCKKQKKHIELVSAVSVP